MVRRRRTELEEETMLGEMESGRPLAVNIPTAARMVGVSPYLIRDYVKANRLESVRLGRRLLVIVASLEKLVREGAPKRTAKDFNLESATV